MKWLLSSIIILLCVMRPATAQEYSGVPRVIDGNTIIINFRYIHLYGIEAPHIEQLCEIDESTWRCGWEATNALAHIVGRHWVTCQNMGSKMQGIIYATCLAGDILNINAWMVRNGWATASLQTSNQLKRLEELARQEQIGIWRTKYENTEHLRRSKNEKAVHLR